jgi:hypothetical protein
MTTRGRIGERCVRRATSVVATLAVAAMPLAGAGDGRATTGPLRQSGAMAPLADATVQAVTGNGGLVPDVQVTAHDNAFWQGSNQITLHGWNLASDFGGFDAFATRAAKAASWDMNVIRLQVHWGDAEPNPPVQNPDGTWTHTYDPKTMKRIRDEVDYIASQGMVVDISNQGDGSFWNFPPWLYEAPYNSHRVTYPPTTDGAEEAKTDFWSDPLRQEFMIDWLKELCSELKSHAGVMSYEILNEPNQGALYNTLQTTQRIVDWQLEAARAIRQADPSRMIMFTTRSGYAPGLSIVDLSGWVDPSSLPQPLGFPDIAVDAHDYFGGRWGTGLSPDQQGYQDLYAHTLSDIPSTYIGTTQGQMQWVRDKLKALQSWKIPLFVGECGVPDGDPGAYLFFGTTTSAFNYTKVSWAVSRAGLGPADLQGNLKPWGQIVIDAVRAYP